MSKTTLYAFKADELGFAFGFADGSQLGAAWSDFTREELIRMAAHGIKQKVADGAAIQRNPDTGLAASNADKIGAMRVIGERWINGRQWNAVREGGGATGGLLLRVLIEMYPAKSREQLTTFLAGKDAKEKAALRANPKIAQIIERLRTENGKAAGIDSDDLLNELADD